MHKHGLEIQEIKAVPGSSESNLPVLIDTKQGETFISSLISLVGRNESCEKRHFLLLRRGRQAGSPQRRQGNTGGCAQLAELVPPELKDRLKRKMEGAGLCVVVCVPSVLTPLLEQGWAGPGLPFQLAPWCREPFPAPCPGSSPAAPRPEHHVPLPRHSVATLPADFNPNINITQNIHSGPRGYVISV